MRNEIAHLDTNALDWTKVAPGSYVKIINLNLKTGERTVLVKLVPAEGMQAPSVPHYHSDSEELLLIEGSITFDGELWLERFAHCFHPARVVHGFSSDVVETTVLLARSSQELDSNDVREPALQVPYLVDAQKPQKLQCYLANLQSKAWKGLADSKNENATEHFQLGCDTTKSERAFLLRCEPNTAIKPPVTTSGYTEIFVLEGSLIDQDETCWTAGHYGHVFDNILEGMLSGQEGAMIYLALG